MEFPKITKYLNFVDICFSYPNRKTLTIGVGNNLGEKLGIIEWKCSWRRYVFVTYNAQDIFDVNCLNDIISVINQLMEERK